MDSSIFFTHSTFLPQPCLQMEKWKKKKMKHKKMQKEKNIAGSKFPFSLSAWYSHKRRQNKNKQIKKNNHKTKCCHLSCVWEMSQGILIYYCSSLGGAVGSNWRYAYCIVFPWYCKGCKSRSPPHLPFSIKFFFVASFFLLFFGFEMKNAFKALSFCD